MNSAMSKMKNTIFSSLSKDTHLGFSKNEDPIKEEPEEEKAKDFDLDLENKIEKHLDSDIQSNDEENEEEKEKENEEETAKDRKEQDKKLEQYLLISHYIDNNIIKTNNIKIQENKKGGAAVESKVVKKDKLNLLIKDLHKQEINRNELYLLNGTEFTYRAYKKAPKKKKKIVLSLVEKLKALKKINNEDTYERKDIDTVYEKFMVNQNQYQVTETQEDETPKRSSCNECVIF